jgi:hypothetical protein
MNKQKLTQIFASDDFDAKIASLYGIAVLMFDHLQKYKWAKRYSDQREDIIDEAMLFIAEKVSRFDPNKAEFAYNYFTTSLVSFYHCVMRLPPPKVKE